MDLQLIEEEKTALGAIFGTNLEINDDTGTLNSHEHGYILNYTYTFTFTHSHLTYHVIFNVFVTFRYPSLEIPTYELKEGFAEKEWINQDMRSEIDMELKRMFGNGGTVVIFEWIEYLHSFLQSRFTSFAECHLVPKITNESSSLKEIITDDSNNDYEGCEEKSTIQKVNEKVPDIYSSEEPIVDRKSIFVAHVASVYSKEQVDSVLAKLKEIPKIRRATHNIFAYRIIKETTITDFSSSPHFSSLRSKKTLDTESTSVVIQDYDDDGESAAGGRLLRLLEVCECKNVMVVVSRWFGGVQLGPDRFKHINNSARSLLSKHGYITQK